MPRVNKSLKWVKLGLAIVLLPFCLGLGRAIWRVLRETGNAETIWVATVAGAVCWIVIFLLLPKPMWIYVLGHELTHALWVWMFGGRVREFKVTSQGGYVAISKTNFLIALAPYFFPLYVVLIVVFFGLGDLAWGWSEFMPWFHLCVGFAYAFHVTLTWHILQGRQTDITEHGYLFSAVVIWIGNMTVLLVGLPLLTHSVELNTVLRWCWEETVRILFTVSHLFR